MHNKVPKNGDIVKCNYNFDEERQRYGLKYPKKGDYLTVREALRVIETGEWVLFFEELILSIPLAVARFDLVQTEMDGDAILNEAAKIENNL
jgi:hypothetical protein